jgi:hypothetical protein
MWRCAAWGAGPPGGAPGRGRQWWLIGVRVRARGRVGSAGAWEHVALRGVGPPGGAPGRGRGGQACSGGLVRVCARVCVRAGGWEAKHEGAAHVALRGVGRGPAGERAWEGQGRVCMQWLVGAFVRACVRASARVGSATGGREVRHEGAAPALRGVGSASSMRGRGTVLAVFKHDTRTEFPQSPYLGPV